MTESNIQFMPQERKQKMLEDVIDVELQFSGRGCRSVIRFLNPRQIKRRKERIEQIGLLTNLHPTKVSQGIMIGLEMGKTAGSKDEIIGAIKEFRGSSDVTSQDEGVRKGVDALCNISSIVATKYFDRVHNLPSK